MEEVACVSHEASCDVSHTDRLVLLRPNLDLIHCLQFGWHVV
jgi:hypothetical protein